MLDSLTFNDAKRVAAETLALLAQHHISPTPTNFEVWFTHLSGARPDLSAEIEKRIAAKDDLAGPISIELFERYFARGPLAAQMFEAREGIARELSEVVATLRSAGDQSASYASALTDAGIAFEGNIDPKNLRAVVNGLAAATREMAVRNHDLSQRMIASTSQIETLQTTLRHVKVEALTDALTGLANRKAFDESLRSHFKAASGELCLLLCDIDHFKRFNDSWGHLVGDQVIRFIARVLKEHAGVEFLAARYGGEEFAIIMPHTGMHRAQAIAGALRQAIRAKRMTRKSTGEVIGPVTISIGIARRRLNDTLVALVERADSCLYAAKQAGRDRVTIDSDLPNASAA